MLLKIGHRGVSAAEFAVAAPILVLLLFGTYDLGNSIQLSLRLERAARAGAQYAMVNPTDADAIRTHVISASPDLTAAEVTVTCQCNGGSMTSCTATCASNLPFTVTVTAQRSLSPLLLRGMSEGTGNAVLRLR
jgi:Flp pilus assembly protein TadG